MGQTNKKVECPDYNITADMVLFFDMDGTLVDTNLANFLAYKKAIFSVTGKDYELTYNSDIRINRSNLKNYVSNLSGSDYQKIIQEKEEYYNDFVQETRINSETADILLKYSKTNKTVLVSNCRKDRAMTTLKHFGLEDLFCHILCRELGDKDQKINKFKK